MEKAEEKPDPQFTRPREILPVLVEANRHYSVCSVKCLLDAVPVVHINVDV
jgi:hypothetical protein